jgi:hypothetical protein
MPRKFFLVAAGMFLLALSYHFGASTATAQAPGNPIVAATSANNGAGYFLPLVLTANGDVYRSTDAGSTWSLVGNVAGGAPTPALHESWGQVKARYHATPGMTVRPGADNR